MVIPTHDRPDFLRRAVRSVLDQTYEGPIECILVFDNTDPIPLGSEGRENRAIRMLANERAPGPAGARNTGLLAARSDVIAFLDDDDEWLPSKLAKQVALLRAGETDVVFSGVRYVADGRYRDYLPVLPKEEPARMMLVGEVFLPIQSLAAWRAAVEPELLDERFPIGGDQDFALRLLLRLSCECLGEALVVMNRAHNSRLSMDFQRLLANIEYMRRKHAALYERHALDVSRDHARYALIALGNRQRRAARRLAARAIRANPWRSRNWMVGALVVALPPISMDRLQALHHRLLWRSLPEGWRDR